MIYVCATYVGFCCHTKAVGLGMVIAAALAKERHMISQAEFDSIVALCQKAKLPTKIPEKMTGDDFIHFMRHDKKVRSGVICYVLPTALGKVDLYKDVSDEEVCKFNLETFNIIFRNFEVNITA